VERLRHDGLHRLAGFERGDLNANKHAIATLKFEHDWGLDSLGNWNEFDEDANGGGFDLEQTRTHNAANEITDLSGTANDPTHDDAGSMTADASNTYIYDAWNRLAEVHDRGDDS